MTALGQKQPLNSLAAQRLLSARSGRGDDINSALLVSSNLPDGQLQK